MNLLHKILHKMGLRKFSIYYDVIVMSLIPLILKQILFLLFLEKIDKKTAVTVPRKRGKEARRKQRKGLTN